MTIPEIEKLLTGISCWPWALDKNSCPRSIVIVGKDDYPIVKDFYENETNNAAFIAAAPTIIRDLLDRLKVAEKSFQLIEAMAKDPRLSERPNVWKTGLDFIEEYSRDALKLIRSTDAGDGEK